MNIKLILINNYSKNEWSLAGNEYAGLDWFDKSPKPTEDELLAQWPDVEYKVTYDAITVARHSAYTAPGGSDSVFMQYQRGEKTEQEWLDAVAAINEANPYPVKAKK